MKYIFIINPKSGVKLNKYIEKKINDRFSKFEGEFKIEYTQYKKHERELALKYYEKGYRNIITVGGDGTIKEIASFCVGKKDVAIGIIPCGSGNGFARNLNIPLDIDKAIDIIFKNRVRKIDCGIVNGDIFLNTCGTGFDAKIAILFNKNKRIRGLLPYFINGIILYFNFKPYKTEIYLDGEKKVFYPLIATVSNGRQYGGGAVISPNSYLDDGYIELIVIENVNFWKFLSNLKSLFDSSILEKNFVKSFKSTNFRIVLPPQSIYHLDGEDYITRDGVLNISVLSKSLNVIS